MSSAATSPSDSSELRPSLCDTRCEARLTNPVSQPMAPVACQPLLAGPARSEGLGWGRRVTKGRRPRGAEVFCWARPAVARALAMLACISFR